MKIYERFHDYLTNTLFSNEKRGDFVYLIVDEHLIINASNILGVSKEDIIKDISGLYHYDRCYNYCIAAVTSIIVIQLYAVSQCESKGNYTANAYRPIIERILNIDKLDIDKWMTRYQDQVWKKFYQWCDIQYFFIEKNTPRTGKGRYVQYPLEQAKYTFNQDDLKYFGYLFKEHNLLPDEDISFDDFWRLFYFSDFKKRHNHHECKIIENIIRKAGKESVKSQIYSFYNIWDGTYITPYSNSIQNKKVDSLNDYTLHLSLKNTEIKVDIRNGFYERIDQLVLSDNFHSQLIKYYKFKQKDLIIFQPNNNYDSYWDETRYVEDKDNSAILITIGERSYSTLSGAKILYADSHIKIQKINYSIYTQEYYSSSEPYFKLVGGLSITKNKYIEGGAPILQILKRSKYWIDGKSYEGNEGYVVLDFSIGNHWIKFPNSKRKEISIVEVKAKATTHDEFLYKWNLRKKENIWEPICHNSGIVGVDFSCYSSSNNQTPLLRKWILAINGNINDDNNMTIKILNNINKYE